MEFFKTSELQSVTVALLWTDHNRPPQGSTHTGDEDTHVVLDTGGKWGCPDSTDSAQQTEPSWALICAYGMIPKCLSSFLT